eukprot:5654173-Karenia_brevis.AAC.1
MTIKTHACTKDQATDRAPCAENQESRESHGCTCSQSLHSRGGGGIPGWKMKMKMKMMIVMTTM